MKKFLKYIPILLFLIIVLHTDCAYADFGDFLKKLKDEALDLAGKTAAKLLGIDTEDNCEPPTLGSTYCLFCPMFRVIVNAASFVADRSYDLFSTELGELVLIFLAVSLSLIILRNIATFGSKDPGALLNDIFRKTFVCITVYIIIYKDYHQFVNTFILPIISSMADFTSIFGSIIVSSSAEGYSGTLEVGTVGSKNEGGLAGGLGAWLVGWAETIENKINILFEFGEWGVCLGNGPKRLFHLIPNPIFILDGIILYLAGLFFMIAYPWVLADALLQFGIAMTLLPFAICGYAFSGTKQYLSRIFSWILNSLFVFLFMAIFLYIILTYIGDFLGVALKGDDPDKIFLNPNQGVAFYGPNMLKIVFLLVIGWAYMPFISKLASSFAEGSGISAAGKLGDAVKNTVDAKTRKAADWGVGVAGNAAKTAARVTDRRIRAGIRQGAMMGIGLLGAGNGRGGKTLSFAGMKFDAQQNSRGKYIERTFTSITGRKHQMASDKYTTIKDEYSKTSGKRIGRKVEFKHGFVQNYLLDKETGRINQGALQTLLDSPLAQKPEYRQAIMEQVAIEMYKIKTGKDVGKYFKSRDTFYDPVTNSLRMEQVDYKGKTTTIEFSMDATTGQVATSWLVQDKHNFSMGCDNGLLHFAKVGKKTAGDIRNGAKILSSQTIQKYSEFAQKGHDHFTDKMDGNQIVESNGSIAQDVDIRFAGNKDYKGDLFAGMRNGICGIDQIDGKSVKDYVHRDILVRNRRAGANKFKINPGRVPPRGSGAASSGAGSVEDLTRTFLDIADGTGRIIGKVDASNVVFGLGGTRIGFVSGGIAYDMSSTPIGHVL